VRRRRLRWALLDIRCGLESGFPLCCIARFAACTLFRGPLTLQSSERGVCGPDENQWVPCLVFHHHKYADDLIESAVDAWRARNKKGIDGRA
jgi:hypothetical protein